MAHILKLTEWESASGWHTNDTSDLANGSGNWWNIPRMLQIKLTDYIKLLQTKFHVKYFTYNPDYNVLMWKWESYQDCHSFTLFVNLQAKKRKFYI